jgi:Uma2 family endonuclease
MANAVLKNTNISIEEYLDGEKQTPIKHEFVNGTVYAMGGASDKHGIISGNIFASIHTQLPDSCEVFISDMKLHTKKNDKQCFYYPDILVSCDKTDNHKYYREKPVLIIEVLSPSTERIDRTEKRERYQLIPELQEYLLIAQEYPKVEIYRRSNAWRAEEYFIEHSFKLESVDMEFKVADLYRRIRY